MFGNPETTIRWMGFADYFRIVRICGSEGLRKDDARPPRDGRGAATGDVHYLDASDAYAHEALLCIQSGDTLKNPEPLAAEGFCEAHSHEGFPLSDLRVPFDMGGARWPQS